MHNYNRDGYGLTGVMSVVKPAEGDRCAVVTIGSHTGKWSNKELVQIGDMVKIRFNQLGEGRVCAYFAQDGYIGVQVEYLDPAQRPEWHVKQCGDLHPEPLVFGAEINLSKKGAA